MKLKRDSFGVLLRKHLKGIPDKKPFRITSTTHKLHSFISYNSCSMQQSEDSKIVCLMNE